jgi:hypothetical protein
MVCDTARWTWLKIVIKSCRIDSVVYNKCTSERTLVFARFHCVANCGHWLMLFELTRPIHMHSRKKDLRALIDTYRQSSMLRF